METVLIAFQTLCWRPAGSFPRVEAASDQEADAQLCVFGIKEQSAGELPAETFFFLLIMVKLLIGIGVAALLVFLAIWWWWSQIALLLMMHELWIGIAIAVILICLVMWWWSQ